MLNNQDTQFPYIRWYRKLQLPRERDRIVLCPSCFSEIDLEVSYCPHCRAEFEKYEEEAGEQYMTWRERHRDVLRIVSIAAVVFSISFALISLFINNLHNWIQPVSSTQAAYIVGIIAGIIVAAGAYELNEIGKTQRERISQNMRIAPYALIAISIIAFAIVIWANAIDSVLSSTSLLVYGLLACVFLLGIMLYFGSADISKSQKKVRG